MTSSINDEKLIIGWKEWCTLPDLHMPLIKAKIDTGAKTSALHAFDITEFVRHGENYVRFSIHPIQNDESLCVTATAPIIDHRSIMSSNGHRENRYVIMTTLQLGDIRWPIELTLSNREPLRYRMLLGRAALQPRVIIDPSASYCLGRNTTKKVRRLYKEIHATHK